MGVQSHGRPLPSYHEAWGTGAAPSDAVAVGAILTGARQLAAVAIVASGAGLVAVVARPARLAGASSSYWVAAEHMREDERTVWSGMQACLTPWPARGSRIKGFLRLTCIMSHLLVRRPQGHVVLLAPRH